MNIIHKKSINQIGYNFIAEEYIPEGKDEYYLRDTQRKNGQTYRNLTAYEIEVLVKSENQADNWMDILVTDKFNPRLVRNCKFHGLIRIGALENYYLEFNELTLRVGIYNCTIISCDIGDNVAFQNVQYLSHYIIGDEVILFNINEMSVTNHAKFGNGIVKDNEDENVRIWVEVSNENGGRKILPFEGITSADAWLWSKYRDDKQLMMRFQEMTEKQFDKKRGYYGTVGDRTIIKNTRIIKDVKIGSDAYIKGGNKLKNLTINSTADAKTQIGEGTELVNGIIGYGSRIFYGVKAVRFIIGENSCLKYGARLINSFLGDNSTISCCEVLNSLIFPSHEQHHNNSFLCASTVLGQSNIASAATIGSNHNSRGADGEIVAGRGFWPALSLSLKHNSKFASFILLAKAAYPAELNIRFPFSLVSRNESQDQLQIMPAYWFMYNMYALARNSWKFAARDKRIKSTQIIEFDYLAPDSINEIFIALKIIEIQTAKAFLNEKSGDFSENELLEQGRKLLIESPKEVDKLIIEDENAEASKNKTVLLKVSKAYSTYREMLHYYSIKTLLKVWEKFGKMEWNAFLKIFENSKRWNWINAGGQLVREDDLKELKNKIFTEQITNWNEFHISLNAINDDYDSKNAAHAYATLIELHGNQNDIPQGEKWKQWLNKAITTCQKLAKLTEESRKKDYSNPYRKMVYDTAEEMDIVLGKFEDNSFVKQTYEDTRIFELKVNELIEFVI